MTSNHSVLIRNTLVELAGIVVLCFLIVSKDVVHLHIHTHSDT